MCPVGQCPKPFNHSTVCPKASADLLLHVRFLRGTFLSSFAGRRCTIWTDSGDADNNWIVTLNLCAGKLILSYIAEALHLSFVIYMWLLILVALSNYG